MSTYRRIGAQWQESYQTVKRWMKIMKNRGPEFEELWLVKYMIFQIEGIKILNIWWQSVYWERFMYSKYTCTHLRNPEPARPFQANPRAITASITTFKAPDWPFHLCQISWGEGFDGCWGGHHLVRLWRVREVKKSAWKYSKRGITCSILRRSW